MGDISYPTPQIRACVLVACLHSPAPALWILRRKQRHYKISSNVLKVQLDEHAHAQTCTHLGLSNLESWLSIIIAESICFICGQKVCRLLGFWRQRRVKFCVKPYPLKFIWLRQGLHNIVWGWPWTSGLPSPPAECWGHRHTLCPSMSCGWDSQHRACSSYWDAPLCPFLKSWESGLNKDQQLPPVKWAW